MENDETVTIGVIGGSGLYQLFEEGSADESGPGLHEVKRGAQ